MKFKDIKKQNRAKIQTLKEEIDVLRKKNKELSQFPPNMDFDKALQIARFVRHAEIDNRSL